MCRFASRYGRPEIDASSQVRNAAGRRDRVWTEISFSLPCFSTDDSDIAIDGDHHLLFAVGDLKDGDIAYHATHRGFTPLISINCSGEYTLLCSVLKNRLVL